MSKYLEYSQKFSCISRSI